MIDLIILAILSVVCYLFWRGGRNKEKRLHEEEIRMYQDDIRSYKQYIRNLHAELRSRNPELTEQGPEQNNAFSQDEQPQPVAPMEYATVQSELPGAYVKNGRKFRQYIPVFLVIAFVVSLAILWPDNSNENKYDNASGYTNKIAEERKKAATSVYKKVNPETTKETKKTPEEVKNEYIEKCISVDYNSIERSPDSYDGTYIVVSGEVIQVSEGWFGSVTLRIESDSGTWYATYIRSDDEQRILDGDNITVYGECKGVETYKTVLGANVTIPSVEIEYYELIK